MFIDVVRCFCGIEFVMMFGVVGLSVVLLMLMFMCRRNRLRKLVVCLESVVVSV